MTSINSSPLFDPFGRRIEYLRVSVTDRCDLRCQYCMAAQMTFLPRKDLLSIEELSRLTDAFIDLGVRKVRLTGGEPLVRRGIMDLISRLSAYLGDGSLDELTLTTNGTQLRAHAAALASAGVRRVNVSLDTLNGAAYRALTRGGQITDVLSGIEAAKAAGIRVKINAVALQNTAIHLRGLIEWAHLEGHDVSLIEVMPLGDTGTDRTDQYVPLSAVRDDLEAVWTLVPSAHRTGGPSRYVDVEETGGRLGFITPLTNNFCEGCNRVRLTCTGRLYQCLGQESHTDFRELMRAGIDEAGLRSAIIAAIARKPYAHDFVISEGSAPATTRHMSVTGG
ncbi:GTP 3',8-cyclase MoaA [Parvularcula sp. LCG005]|nr:GTP 3',8-cyclase MoaA [Parvularcula sp. LCG005]WOI52213.1 GTP 3',8-cyclase MoaA [Parvularcula sp. LCG005]